MSYFRRNPKPFHLLAKVGGVGTVGAPAAQSLPLPPAAPPGPALAAAQAPRRSRAGAAPAFSPLSCRPSLQELFPGNYAPAPAHLFMKLLHDKGLLLRVCECRQSPRAWARAAARRALPAAAPAGGGQMTALRRRCAGPARAHAEAPGPIGPSSERPRACAPSTRAAPLAAPALCSRACAPPRSLIPPSLSSCSPLHTTPFSLPATPTKTHKTLTHWSMRRAYRVAASSRHTGTLTVRLACLRAPQPERRSAAAGARHGTLTWVLRSTGAGASPQLACTLAGPAFETSAPWVTHS
jgi:hypothetical protein